MATDHDTNPCRYCMTHSRTCCPCQGCTCATDLMAALEASLKRDDERPCQICGSHQNVGTGVNRGYCNAHQEGVDHATAMMAPLIYTQADHDRWHKAMSDAASHANAEQCAAYERGNAQGVEAERARAVPILACLDECIRVMRFQTMGTYAAVTYQAREAAEHALRRYGKDPDAEICQRCGCLRTCDADALCDCHASYGDTLGSTSTEFRKGYDAAYREMAGER